ncbi:DUF6134 family protein [Acidocella sp. KAb 2-4]|uniref:DUF6134 family protein n=1 Tax=Acidocella sp. KAb 2-4 TaxID=2885158 RepID=UPI001D084620|nr:DUF6134 family protein [Acidocella sp. KAb 2-4]
MRRRQWMLGAAGLLAGFGRAAEALPVPPADQLAFEIWRKGRQIGTHTLSFAQAGDALAITIAVRIAVYFGPIRLFHYRMDGIEQWQGGRMFHIETATNNNGRADHMRADLSPAGLMVQGSGTARYIAPANALPSTHWNIAELNGPWINPDNGKLLHPHVAALGEETVPAANGTTVAGQHYRLSGDAKIDLWYGAGQSWCALGFTGKDGSKIHYLRRDV